MMPRWTTATWSVAKGCAFGLVRDAVRRPVPATDTDPSRSRLVGQAMDEVAELALGATPFDPAVNQRRDHLPYHSRDIPVAGAHRRRGCDCPCAGRDRPRLGVSLPPGGRACALHLAIQRDGRHARCLALHTRPEARMDGRLYHGLPVPPCDPFVAPILYAIPIAQCYVA